MSEELSKDFFVSTIVSELFTIESQLCSTRTADLFKAFDKQRGKPVAVWMLRSQFEANSGKMFEFTNRLGRMAIQGGASSQIISAGVDPSGVVFSVIPTVDGYPILGGNVDALEAERRFIAICHIIEQLHSAGITCGDLCPNSFWVTRDGNIRFVGVMGSFEEEGPDAPVPPLETIYYQAPEQHLGGVPTPFHDVFAIGVIGYQLFTRQQPYPDITQRGASKPVVPRQLAPAAPMWIDEVILKCIETIPSRRYSSAGALLTGLQEIKERIIKDESSVAARETRNVATREKTDGSVLTFKSPEREEEKKVEPPPTDPKRIIIVAGIFAVLLLFVGGAVFFIISSGNSPPETEPVEPEVAVHHDAADPKMREAIDVVNNNDTALTDKRLKFQELEQSDDPLAHDILVRGAVDAENTNIRRLAEQAIIARANRTKLVLPAGAVNAWLESTSIESPPPEYEYVLKALNASIPTEGRKEFLQKVAATNPDLAGRLLASLILNQEDGSEYLDAARELLAGSFNNDIPSGVTAEAILATKNSLFSEFSASLIERLRRAPKESLEWLLKISVQQNLSNMSTIADILLTRDFYSPLKQIYLRPLKENDTLPDGMAPVLVRATDGSIGKGDVETIGMWLDKSAESLLLAICADNTSDELKIEAVEYLAGRGLSGEPQASFVKWIKRNAWEKKGNLALPLGVASLSKLIPRADMERALTGLEGYSKNSAIFSILFLAENPEFIELVLNRFKSAIPSTSLITLLAHPSKQVRLAAIQSIRDVNDVGVLQAIIELYNAEVDPEVRKAYSDNLWVIKQRLEEKK